MNKKFSWIAYDWFKLLIALILLIILILLLLRPPFLIPITGSGLPEYPQAAFAWKFDTASRSLINSVGTAIYTLGPDGEKWVPIIPQDIQSKLPAGFKFSQNGNKDWTLQDSKGKLLYFWDTSTLHWTPVYAPPALLPTSTTSSAAPTGIPTSPLSAPADTPAATPTAACTAPALARLTVGKTAEINSTLNLRSEPAIGENIIAVNLPGTLLKVLQGPVCVPYGNSAYLWWQVETPDGKVGWSAEGSLNGAYYFLSPAQ